MSDWEEFCENMGVNPGCPDDYDRLMDGLQSGTWSRCRESAADYAEYEDLEPAEHEFAIFDEAADWARRNAGSLLTRSADGTRFVVKEAAAAAPKKGGVPAFCRRDYLPPGTKWVPGTFPVAKEDDELFDLDFEHEQRTFWPRLKKLAPEVVRLAYRNHSWINLHAKSLRFRELAPHELDELEALLTEKLNRGIRWYETQREDKLKRIAERKKSGYAKNDAWLRKRDEMAERRSRTPDEILFWEKALELVQEELAWVR